MAWIWRFACGLRILEGFRELKNQGKRNEGVLTILIVSFESSFNICKNKNKGFELF